MHTIVIALIVAISFNIVTPVYCYGSGSVGVEKRFGGSISTANVKKITKQVYNVWNTMIAGAVKYVVNPIREYVVVPVNVKLSDIIACSVKGLPASKATSFIVDHQKEVKVGVVAVTAAATIYGCYRIYYVFFPVKPAKSIKLV